MSLTINIAHFLYGYTQMCFTTPYKVIWTPGRGHCQGSLRPTDSEINPLRSNGDQCQISLCNINAFSVREVMRIKDMITRHEFRQ